MYRVIIQKLINDKKERSADAVMKTEKLYELLGRFLLQYGPPEMVEETHGIMEFEYYKQLENNNYKSATVWFAKIGEAEKKQSAAGYSDWRNKRDTTPPPPPMPTEPDDDRITELLTKGIIETASYYR